MTDVSEAGRVDGSGMAYSKLSNELAASSHVVGDSLALRCAMISCLSSIGIEPFEVIS